MEQVKKQNMIGQKVKGSLLKGSTKIINYFTLQMWYRAAQKGTTYIIYVLSIFWFWTMFDLEKLPNFLCHICLWLDVAEATLTWIDKHFLSRSHEFKAMDSCCLSSSL